MPSQRKRIGFLPTVEVQEIIDRISSLENLSQSRVTGILVEEALRARKNIREKNLDKDSFNKNIGDFENHSKVMNIKDEDNQLNLDNELKLVKEYVEYKRFKNLLKRVIDEE
tara:strand:- start:4657 stop:4992 length:336 start_codon:yes stop_codon:yes gene_type:complete